MRPRTFIRALSVLLFSLPGAWAAELELRCKLEQNQYICSQETDPDAEETPNEAVAEGPNTSLVTCKPYSDNVSFAPFNKDGAIGTHYFGSKEECEKAISMQSQGWICTRGPGNGLSSPFNIKEGKDGGEFYLNGLDECLRAIQNVKGDLICAAGWSRTSFIAWDFKQGHYVENHSNGSLDSCNQRINSGKAGEKAHVVEAALHDCSHVRMDEPGGSMEHVAVRDQGTLPICAAETVAQVTDAWRFANGDTNYDFQTSGLYAALLA
ncbi:MAG: hypothetical protein NDJ90_07045, partial [Oligoflexia bacterium]|nr:hypothetical protein [Oligoflexia bacterium]